MKNGLVYGLQRLGVEKFCRSTRTYQANVYHVSYGFVRRQDVHDMTVGSYSPRIASGKERTPLLRQQEGVSMVGDGAVMIERQITLKEATINHDAILEASGDYTGEILL